MPILINEDLCVKGCTLCDQFCPGDIIYRLDPQKTTSDKVRRRMLVLRQLRRILSNGRGEDRISSGNAPSRNPSGEPFRQAS